MNSEIRPPILGMNVFGFLRILIRVGRIEPGGEGSTKSKRKEGGPHEGRDSDKGMTKAALPAGKQVKLSEEKTNQGGAIGRRIKK